MEHEILDLIDRYWKFDDNQQPISNWHDKQDLLEAVRKALRIHDVVGRSEQFYCTDWNRSGAICEEQCSACKKAENMPEHDAKLPVTCSSGVIRTERGWAGHFICSNRCRFRRNTLLAFNDIKIVVSTVGLMEIDEKFETIGNNRHFETMAFHSKPTDTRYYDADVSKQVYFDSKWAISEQDADNKANEMHEAVVLEITNKLLAGETFPVTER